MLAVTLQALLHEVSRFHAAGKGRRIPISGRGLSSICPAMILVLIRLCLKVASIEHDIGCNEDEGETRPEE